MEISQGCRSRMHIGFSTSMIKVQKKIVHHHQMECIVCRRQATAEHGNKSICAFNVFLEFAAQIASPCVWPRARSRPPPRPCCAQMCFSPLLPPKRHPSFGCSSFHTSPICTDNQTVIHLFTFSCVSLKLIE